MTARHRPVQAPGGPVDARSDGGRHSGIPPGLASLSEAARGLAAGARESRSGAVCPPPALAGRPRPRRRTARAPGRPGDDRPRRRGPLPGVRGGSAMTGTHDREGFLEQALLSLAPAARGPARLTAMLAALDVIASLTRAGGVNVASSSRRPTAALLRLAVVNGHASCARPGKGGSDDERPHLRRPREPRAGARAVGEEVTR